MCRFISRPGERRHKNAGTFLAAAVSEFWHCDAPEPPASAQRVMRENMHTLPRDLDLDEMSRSLVSHDELALRRTRIDRLLEKLADTDIALSMDVMRAALRGYAMLKLNGQVHGLDVQRRDLGKRFVKTARRKPGEVTEAA